MHQDRASISPFAICTNNTQDRGNRPARFGRSRKDGLSR